MFISAPAAAFGVLLVTLLLSTILTLRTSTDYRVRWNIALNTLDILFILVPRRRTWELARRCCRTYQTLESHPLRDGSSARALRQAPPLFGCAILILTFA